MRWHAAPAPPSIARRRKRSHDRRGSDSRLTASAASSSAEVPSAMIDSAVTAVASLSTPGAAAFNLRVVSDASPDPDRSEKLRRQHDVAMGREPREGLGAVLLEPHPQAADRSHRAPWIRGDRSDPELRGLRLHDVQHGDRHQPVAVRAIGLRHQYWDICNHTVSAVEDDGEFHMVDSSMSNLVTTGRWRDAGVGGGSGGRVGAAGAASAACMRPAPDGFLTGTDTIRNLAERGRTR